MLLSSCEDGHIRLLEDKRMWLQFSHFLLWQGRRGVQYALSSEFIKIRIAAYTVWIFHRGRDGTVASQAWDWYLGSSNGDFSLSGMRYDAPLWLYGSRATMPVHWLLHLVYFPLSSKPRGKA
ncbi:hypothetical protein B0G81_7802 [Paraburkholderia sp. BL6665CI2N2]|nr:hypothetical protein B0G81_7802 [Paraburkholderia sp. BL6665CI2N2]